MDHLKLTCGFSSETPGFVNISVLKLHQCIQASRTHVMHPFQELCVRSILRDPHTTCVAIFICDCRSCNKSRHNIDDVICCSHVHQHEFLVATPPLQGVLPQALDVHARQRQKPQARRSVAADVLWTIHDQNILSNLGNL